MRAWTIRDEGKRPLTVNAVSSLHRQAWAKSTKATRETWAWLAKAQRIPALDRIRVDVTPLHRDGRSPQDVAAAAPAAKAAIDGLVDAGVLTDDDQHHLVCITFWPPVICGVDGLELTITEIEGAA